MTFVIVRVAGTGTGLIPGGTPLTETVNVNVVFVGIDEPGPVGPGRDDSCRRFRVARRRGTRLRTGSTRRPSSGSPTPTAYNPVYASTSAWENSFFALPQSTSTAKPLDGLPGRATTSQKTGRETSTQRLDRRADRREAADRHRTAGGRHHASRRSSSSTGADARLRLPRLHQDRRARSRHRATTSGSTADTRKLIAWGGTPPDDEETGLGRAASTASGSTTCRPAPSPGAATTTSTTPTSTATARRTTGSRPSWEYRRATAPGSGERGARDGPRQGDPLRRARPAVHELAAVPALLHGRPICRARSTWTSTRSRAGRGSTRRASTSRPTCSSPRSGSSPPGTSTSRGLPGPRRSTATSTAATAQWRAGRRLLLRPTYRLPGGANLFLSRGASTTKRVPRGGRRLRGGARQLRDRRRPKGAGPARLRRRQLARRHPERRVQLRLPGRRRRRLRADDDDDPRVRAPLVDEPPARRLRLRRPASTSSRPATATSPGSATSPTR